MPSCSCPPNFVLSVPRPGVAVTIAPYPIARIMAGSCPLADRTFDRTEIPAFDLAITAVSREQDLSDAVVTLDLYEATATPRTPLGTWDNQSGSGNNPLGVRHLERSRVVFAALIDFGVFVPELEIGTRVIEYELAVAFQGQRYKLETGLFKVV